MFQCQFLEGSLELSVGSVFADPENLVVILSHFEMMEVEKWGVEFKACVGCRTVVVLLRYSSSGTRGGEVKVVSRETKWKSNEGDA